MPDPVDTGTFVIVTRKGKLTGAALTYWITIDGATDTIGGGQSFQVPLKPGSHQIELETTAAGSKRQRDEFVVTAGQVAEYEIGFSAWSGPKLSRVR